MCCRKKRRCGRANYHYEISVEEPRYNSINSGTRGNNDDASEPPFRVDAGQVRGVWRPNPTLSLVEILAEKVRVAHENKMMRREAARRQREQQWRQLKHWLSGDSDDGTATGKVVAPSALPPSSQSLASTLSRPGQETQRKGASVPKPSSPVSSLPSASMSRPTRQEMSSYEDEPPPSYDAAVAHPPRNGLASWH